MFDDDVATWAMVLEVFSWVGALVNWMVEFLPAELVLEVELGAVPVTPIVVRTDGVPSKWSGRVVPDVAEQSQSPREPSCAWQQYSSVVAFAHLIMAKSKIRLAEVTRAQPGQEEVERAPSPYRLTRPLRQAKGWTLAGSPCLVRT